jgi:YD repeat-containing protein
VTTYEYDDLDRLVQITLPDPTDDSVANPPIWTYAYDKLGRMTAMTDPLGNVTAYTYDARGRLTNVTLADPDDRSRQERPFCKTSGVLQHRRGARGGRQYSEGGKGDILL